MAILQNTEKTILAVMCIGKTGGTSLSNALHSRFGARYCLRELQHLGFSILGHIHRNELELYLRQMPQTQFDELRMLVGHIPVGLGTTFRRAEFQYVTMLREPIARLISTYFYLNQSHLRLDTDYLNAEFHRAISSKTDVIYDNPMVRVFTGSEALVPRLATEESPAPPEVTNNDLNIALENLRGFKFVGLTERFGDSIRLIFRLLGEEFNGSPPRDNETNITLRREQIHPDTLAVLRRSTQLDQKLYAEAARIFSGYATHASLPPFTYQAEVIPEVLPMSSGDYCQYTSAEAALSSREDGIWMSSSENGDGAWLGMDLGHASDLETLSIQLPKDHAPELNHFALEVSNDAFRNHIVNLAHLQVPDNGETHVLKITDGQGFRYLRLRCTHKHKPAPLQIAFLGINRSANETIRNMNAVIRQIAKAKSIISC